VDQFDDAEDARQTLREPSASNKAKLQKKRLAPTLLYIGPDHSGSTTLADLMNMHPNLSYGRTKEHRFLCPHPWDIRRWDNYLDEFEVDQSVTRTFDATPVYMQMGAKENPPCQWCPGHPWNQCDTGVSMVKNNVDLLMEKTPGATLQIIATFRNPVDWWCSKMHIFGACDNETQSEKSMRNLQNFPCYAEFLEPFLSVLDRSQFLFLKSEDAFEDQQTALNSVLDFVGVKRMPIEQGSYSAGRRRSHMQMPTDVRLNFLQSERQQWCKQRLEQMTGLTFAW